MSILELLSQLRDLGIALRIEDGRLRVLAPKGVLTNELAATLRERKQALLDYLQKAAASEGPEPIPIASREGELALSHSQQRLWFLDQLEKGSSAYNIPTALRITGSLDLDALSRAVKTIVARHETLRTNFASTEGRPYQIVSELPQAELVVVSLEDFPPASRDAALQKLADEVARQPFDLASDPLLRTCLVRLGPDDFAFLASMHHIISDGWSLGIFTRELMDLYKACHRGLADPLPPLLLQYADFAVWQREYLAGDVLARQLNYWKKRLAGIPELLDLPTDRPRPPVQTSKGAILPFHLEQPLAEPLAQLARETSSTLFMILLTAFKLLLSRYSRMSDIVVGSPIASRARPELEPLIGMFVNNLVLRTDMGARQDGSQATWRDLIEAVRTGATEAYDHQDLPFEELVDALKPERNLGYTPLFQVMFVWQNLPTGSTRLEELVFAPLKTERATAKFDLMLTMFGTREGLGGELSYNSDLYNAKRMQSFVRHFRTVLQTMALDPDQSAVNLSLLAPDERERLLVTFNQTEISFPETTIHQLFEQQAARTPNSVAVAGTLEDGTVEKLTYANLNKRANRYAHELLQMGVEAETPVGIYMARGLETLPVLLGVLKSGAAFLPLDPAYPDERTTYMIEDAAAPFVIGYFAPPDMPPGVTLLKPCRLDDRLYPNPELSVQPERAAYFIYTSGSTGRPKGVSALHRGAINRFHWMWRTFPFGADEVGCQKTSLNFADCIWEFFGPLLQGVPVVVLPKQISDDLPRFVAALAAHRVSRMVVVPSLLGAFLDIFPDLPERLPHLRTWTTSGEAVRAELVRRFHETMGEGYLLINLYGSSEASADSTAHLCTIADEGDVPIGKPIDSTSLYILDDRLRPAPIGSPGVLHVAGVGLSRGYHRRAGLTAEHFIPHAFSKEPGQRLYRTGDLASWREDGVIRYLGRVDRQIKLRGFRIELAEIELALTGLPEVEQAVVLLHRSANNEPLLAAWYTANASIAGNLSDRLRRVLPEYMLPSFFEPRQEMPLTPNGKIDRMALLRQPLPEPALQADNDGEPATPTEEVLAGLWSEVLGIPRVGTAGHFFALGGHSLLATRLMARVARVFEVDLPLRALFEAPRLGELAERIDAASRFGPSRPPLVAHPREGELPLAFAQQRIWVLDQLEAGYNMTFAFRLEGNLDRQALEQVFCEISRRHEVLRTRFPAHGGRPYQAIDPPAKVTIPVSDLSSLAPEEKESELFRQVAELAAFRFDLSADRLFLPILFRLDEAEWVLQLTIHHILFDGWSVGVVTRELATLYVYYRDGGAYPLPELPVQYADYVTWQRSWMEGEVLHEQVTFWENHLAGAPDLLLLPADFPRPAVAGTAGDAVNIRIDGEQASALQNLGNRFGATLYMVLNSTFALFLGFLSGRRDPIIGSPIANRSQIELEPLIGFFANTLALRSDLNGDPSFTELLERTRRLVLEAYAHQDVPFEHLVEMLNPRRDLGYAPIAQVFLALQNAPLESLSLPGLTLGPFERSGMEAKFDLVLNLYPNDRALNGLFIYRTDLFERATVEKMARGFTDLLGRIIDGPERSLSELAPASLFPCRPAAIESVIRHQPGVAAAKVILESGPFGARPVAFVAFARETELKDFEERLRSELPGYMMPDALVPLSALPLDPRGEVDKQVLAELDIIRDLPRNPPVVFLPGKRLVHVANRHLNELVPGFGEPSGNVSTKAAAAFIEAGPQDRLALSDGGPLDLDSHPPTLTEALVKTAGLYSERGVTYIFGDGRVQVQTYSELLEEARLLRAGLEEAGLVPGDFAIFQTATVRETLPLFWACLLTGVVPAIVAVPPVYEAGNSVVDKLLNTWNLLDRPALLCSDSSAASISGLDMLEAKIIRVADLTGRDTDRVDHSPRKEDVAFFQLTSGSTGIPKCIPERHNAIIAHIVGSALSNGHRDDDILMNWLAMDHVGSILFFHIRAAYLGCAQVMAETDYILADPLHWIDLLSRYRATHTWSPNFGYKLVVDSLHREQIRDWDLSAMKSFVNGGEQATLPVIRAFLDLLAPVGLEPRMIQPCFGMAELCTVVCWPDPFSPDSGVHCIEKSSLGGRLATVSDPGRWDDADTVLFMDLGSPNPGTRIRIVDEENRLLPEGVIGRFQAQGPVVMPGYFRNEEANREAFSEGWFNTGDLGFIRMGKLIITGREKETIVVHGANFFCHEIEAVVEETAGVRATFSAACAVATDEGTEGLAVFLVADGDGPGARLCEAVAQKVTVSLGIHPKYVIPLAAEDFPKTTSGKIQRGNLAAQLEEGDFDELIFALDMELGNERTLPDWFCRETWIRCELPEPDRRKPRRLLVFSENNLLEEALGANGDECLFVRPAESFRREHERQWCLNPSAEKQFVSLLDDLVAGDLVPDEILFLWPLAEPSRGDDIERLEHESFSLLFLARALKERTMRLLIGTRSARAVAENEMPDLEGAVLGGFLRTLAAESENLEICHVDLDEANPLAAAKYLLAELDEFCAEVAWRDGVRRVPGLESLPETSWKARPLPFKQGGIWLVSGGLGGVGVALLSELLDRYHLRVLILGRRPQPQDIFATLRQRGDLLYCAADIADEDAVRSAVNRAELYWDAGLEGVLNLAGTFREGPLLEETLDGARSVLHAKINGARGLHRALGSRSECCWIHFSSVTSLLGGPSFGFYAAANAALEAFSNYQRGSCGLDSSCLAWSMWRGIGMSESYEDRVSLIRTQGSHALTSQQGWLSFIAALANQHDFLHIGLDVSSMPVRRLLRRPPFETRELIAWHPPGAELPEGITTRRQEIPASALNEGVVDQTLLARISLQGDLPTGSGSTFVAPRTETERRIAVIWRDVLGQGELSVEDNFFALGGHSLLATQVVSRLNSTFELDLKLAALFTAPTISSLRLLVDEAGASQQHLQRPPEPIPRDGRQLPLSFAQQRLWFLDQLEGPSPTYNIPFALRMRGDLNLEALERSLETIVARHENLRTLFPIRDGKPLLAIREQMPISIPVTELSELDPESHERVIASLAREDARIPFILATGPVFRLRLLRLGADHHVLLVNMHHIISDGWSMGVLSRELVALYPYYLEGAEPDLPELPIQYADFSWWQHHQLEKLIEAQRGYWVQRLVGAPSKIELPTDRPRPDVQAYNGTKCPIRIDAATTASLAALAKQADVSLFMLLHAAFAVLLARYSGGRDILIGSPVAGRNRLELEPLIGFFVNTLAYRHDLSGDPTFSELLARVKQGILEADANQDISFEQVVDAASPERALNHHPLFQVAFTFFNRSEGSLSLPGLDISQLEASTGIVRYDMNLFLTEGETITGSIVFNSDLWEKATMERMTKHFCALLGSAAGRGDQRLSELSLLDEGERRRVLVDWNATEANYPRENCIHELFEAQTAATPDATALILPGPDGVVSMSYDELNRRANRLAHRLIADGVFADSPVGLALVRSFDAIAAMLAILKAGGAYVPFDTDSPQERLSFIIADTGISTLLTTDPIMDLLPAYDLTFCNVILLDEEDEALASEPEQNPDMLLQPENQAYIMFTSGSTGTPKGVQATHRAVTRLVFGLDYVDLGPQRTLLQVAPFFFDAATFEIWGALLHGARLILYPERVPTPEKLAEALDQGVDTLWLTSSLFNFLVDTNVDLLTGVRQLLAGGEALSVDHVRRALQHLPRTTLINGYGPTEGTTFSCCNPLGEDPGEVASISIGRPIANTRVYITDSELSPLPVGLPGELLIGGDGLARGYLNHPKLTAERFIPDLFALEPGLRLYRSGDRTSWQADGSVQFLERLDHQVKLRGFRIEPGEIETCLGSYPGMGSRVVMKRSLAGESHLVAYLTEEQAASSDSVQIVENPPFEAPALRRFLAEKLPEYMIPSLYVTLTRLPLTPNGKVDRGALPLPQNNRPAQVTTDRTAAGTPIGEILRGVWADTLNLENVDLHDNFFDLGGHSLIAVQVISRVREIFEVEITLSNLFEHPTPYAFAEQVRNSGKLVATPPILPVSRELELPLSFAQLRLWIVDQAQPGLAHYNSPLAIRFKGRLNLPALERALDAMRARHENLRTTFAHGDVEPVQVIEPYQPRPLPLLDLSGLADSLEERKLVHYEARLPFDLTRGPLMRTTLLRIAAREHLLMLTMHHIITDGWSLGVATRELSHFYHAAIHDDVEALPPLPIQYADFAFQQRAHLQGQVQETLLDYWRDQFADAPETSGFPTDRPHPELPSHEGASEFFQLDLERTAELRALSHRNGSTLFMTLLAAFKVLLYRESGGDDLIVGTVTASRNQIELEPLIGFFVNQLALRTKLGPGETGPPSFLELLARVRRTTLDAYANQDLPFQKLVGDLNVPRRQGSSPLFQVMFILQNTPGEPLDLHDLELRVEGGEHTAALFDLVLSMAETSQGLTGSVRYATELYDRETILRLIDRFRRLLDGIIELPDTAVTDLNLSNEGEQTTLVADDIDDFDLNQMDFENILLELNEIQE